MKMKRRIKRRCLDCGKYINITLDGNKYSNGNYFGKFESPIGPGKYKKVGTTKIGRKKFDLVRWTGKQKKIEYWECNKCFNEPGP